MTVGAAQAGDVHPLQMERGHILAVALEIFQSEFEGDHGMVILAPARSTATYPIQASLDCLHHRKLH